MVFMLLHTGPHNTLNLLLSSSAEEFGFHDDRLLRELSFPQNFVVALEQRKGFIIQHGRDQLLDEYEERYLPTHFF